MVGEHARLHHETRVGHLFHHDSNILYNLMIIEAFHTHSLSVSHREYVGCSLSSKPFLHDSFSICGTSRGTRCTFSFTSRFTRRSSPSP